MADCLDNLVGLSDRSCPCEAEDRPESYNVSESGYFLTDSDCGLPVNLSVLEDCDSDIWQSLAEARDKALIRFRTDLRAELNVQYDHKLHPFSGEIGRRKANSTRVVTGAYAGQMLEPRAIRDAAFVLTSIFVGLNASATFDVTIASSDPDFVSQDIEVTSIAGQFVKKTLTTPISLPFYCVSCDDYDDADRLRYYISYPTASGMPLNNDFSCGCGGKKNVWEQYMCAQGFSADTVVTNRTGTSFANGIVLEGYLTCGTLNWLCALDALGGYDAKSTIARAIQFKASSYAISKVLDSNNLNYYTMLGQKELFGKRSSYEKKYADYISYIASKLPKGATDCFKCKPVMSRKSL